MVYKIEKTIWKAWIFIYLYATDHERGGGQLKEEEKNIPPGERGSPPHTTKHQVKRRVPSININCGQWQFILM